MRTVTVVILVLGAAFAWLWHQAGQSSELSQKPDISRLQGVEFAHRGKNLDEPIIFDKEDGTCSVGILATDKKTRDWILLHSPTTTRAFRSVARPYMVTQSQMDEIQKECSISPEAMTELRSHLGRASM